MIEQKGMTSDHDSGTTNSSNLKKEKKLFSLFLSTKYYSHSIYII